MSLVQHYREARAAGKVFVIVIGSGNTVDAAAGKLISHYAAEDVGGNVLGTKAMLVVAAIMTRNAAMAHCSVPG